MMIDSQLNIIDSETGVVQAIENNQIEFSKKKINQLELIKDPKKIKSSMQTIDEASIESSLSEIPGHGPLEKVATVQRVVGDHIFYDSFLDITNEKQLGSSRNRNLEIPEPYLKRDIAHITSQIDKMEQSKSNAMIDFIYSDRLIPA